MTALAMAITIAGTACSSDEGDDLPPPASPGSAQDTPAPAESLDPRDAEAWDEIQARFDGFMETWIKWAADGRPGGFVDPATAELHEYAEAFLLDEVVAELTQEARDGNLRMGQPEWRDSQLLTLDWDRTVQELSVPEAVFEVCVDDSDWLVVDAETDEPVSAEPRGPHVWTMTARWAEEPEFGPDGWALFQREIDRSRLC
jgi:hypothetical protein